MSAALLTREDLEDLETEGYFEPGDDGAPVELSVRIKPYNPRKQILAQRYHIGGQLFRADRGWYRSGDLEFLKQLADARQHAGDPESPMVFDIMKPEDAEAAEIRESRGTRAGASEPIAAARRTSTLTTKDAVARKPKMIDPAEDDEPVLSDEEIAKSLQADDAVPGPSLGRKPVAAKSGGRKVKSSKS